MPTIKFQSLLRIAPVLALCSCVAPKAVVVKEAPVKKTDEVAEAAIPEPTMPTDPNDGIRLPDMLDLPSDGEFRAASPMQPKPGGEPNAVIARPPTDPPSRPKPKDAE